MATKKRICNILINNNEGLGADVRLCQHQSYSMRQSLISKCLKNKNEQCIV